MGSSGIFFPIKNRRGSGVGVTVRDRAFVGLDGHGMTAFLTASFFFIPTVFY